MRDLNVALAREARLRRHLRRMGPLFGRLRASGLTEPNVLAILAVESFYRPRLLRAFEYVAWAGLSLLAPALATRLSVGLAQMRLENWVSVGLLDSIRFSPARLRRVRSAEASYEACRRYLSAVGALHESDPAALARAYAGGDRRHFALMLDQARRARAQAPRARVAV